MTILILILIFSLLANGLLIWYVTKILSKLLYTSDNLGDLYTTFRLYEKFTTSMYEMDMFYGEPILKELIDKTKLVCVEIKKFEEIYSLTTDVEYLEEELLSDEIESSFPAEEAKSEET